jgi:hypothetical protein
VFVIPEEGSRGLRFDEAGQFGSSSSALEQVPGPDAASGASAAVPSVEETSSGILIEPSLSSAAASRTATVRLSRREVVANLMKPSRLSLEEDDLEDESERRSRLRPSVPIRRQGEQGLPAALEGTAAGDFIPLEDEEDDELPPSHRPQAPASRPPIRFSDMPAWVPKVDLDPDESIIEFEAGAESSLAPHYLLTGIPVFLIPVAVVLAQFWHPAASASACFLLALVLWGIFAAVKLPSLGRKILILTTQRAIMTDTREVVDIDID